MLRAGALSYAVYICHAACASARSLEQMLCIVWMRVLLLMANICVQDGMCFRGIQTAWQGTP